MKAYKILLVLSGLCLFTGAAFAAGGGDGNIGDVANNLTGTFTNVTKLITAGSYVAGLAFGIGSILKFKAHKDNPQQVPVGTPIALLFVAAALIFFPSIASMSGFTLFKSGGTTAGVNGTTTFAS